MRDARQDLALARQNANENQADSIAYNDTNEGTAFPEAGFGHVSSVMNSPRFQELSSRMMLNSQYGGFINNLNLTTEERDELNEIMTDVLQQQNALRMQLASGEITINEYQSAIASLNMEDAMASFLTTDEMDQYYTYQDQQEERQRQQIETAMNMQLTMQTPGLSEDNRKRLSDLLSQQIGSPPGLAVSRTAGSGVSRSIGFSSATIRTDNGDNGPGAVDARVQGFAAQAETYDNIRQELEGSMVDEQMEIVENYLEQQEMQMEMVQELMSQQGNLEGGIFISQ